MCGICGFTGASPENTRDGQTLKAMCDIMAHRGPDGEGCYIDAGAHGGIALGHRRLSLIDLEGGNQPMVRATSEKSALVTSPALGPDGQPREGAQAAAAKGRWCIVFNGEIYNYRELRAQLQADGWTFATNSDTEVLLVGYIAWGEEVLLKLRGMFAFAIWDRESGELFCARDFFGIKPFYYTVVEGAEGEGNPNQPADKRSEQPKRFIFASETKSILEHPAYERRLNEEALAAYLCFQFSALQETFFKGIFKLPQGHSLRVMPDGTLKMNRYWQPRYNFNTQRSAEETVQAIDDVMRDSVRYHNVADVEVGSFLSSGIDSSYMAACLAKENPAIKTFTVGFAEYVGERDEISWARDLAKQLGIANTSKHITEAEYWESLPLVQWHMDEPSADPSAVALYFVDQLAATQVKAVLSGEGADEFFGGYRIYQAPFSNAKLAAVPKPVLRAAAKLLRKLGIRGANYLQRASQTPEDWYYTNANGVAFSEEERAALLSPAFLEQLANNRTNVSRETSAPSIEDARTGLVAQAVASNCKAAALESPQTLTAPIYAEVASLDETTRMQYVDLWFWLVGDILLKTDKMSMAHSLESRVPFLDREVFALSATIPTAQKVSDHQTKLALREAAERAIPKDWAQKEKLGFPVPVTAWLREDAYYNQVMEAFTSEQAAEFFNIEELRRLLEDHKSGTRDNTRRIWIIYMFLMWYDIYFVKREKPQMPRTLQIR